MNSGTAKEQHRMKNNGSHRCHYWLPRVKWGAEPLWRRILSLLTACTPDHSNKENIRHSVQVQYLNNSLLELQYLLKGMFHQVIALGLIYNMGRIYTCVCLQVREGMLRCYWNLCLGIFTVLVDMGVTHISVLWMEIVTQEQEF